jgi:hypothetical protein
MEFQTREQRQAEIAATLAGHAALLERLRLRVEPFFSQAVAGKVFEGRRPSLALRVCALGEPAGRLAIYPHFLHNHTVLELVGGKVHVEFLAAASKDPGTLAFSKRLGFLLGNGTPRVGSYYPKTVAEDLRRLFETAAAFLEDPLAAFARSSNNCCICGRGLSDAQSRSRGIGPECLQKCGFFRAGREQWDAGLEAQGVAMAPRPAPTEGPEDVPPLSLWESA